MTAVNELALRNPALTLPDCFALCTETGAAYEVWEWITSQPAEPIVGASIRLREFFSSFVSATTSMGWTGTTDWHNQSLNAFVELAEAEHRMHLLGDERIPIPCRLLLLLAEDIAADPDFRRAARTLPIVFVHSDIRPSNFVNKRLIDFSNSRPDFRIVEFSRFLLLNLDAERAFAEALVNPHSLLTKSQVALTSVELWLFIGVVVIDFCNLYTWALRHVVRGGSDKVYAQPFLSRCEEQATWICGKLQSRHANLETHRNTFPQRPWDAWNWKSNAKQLAQ